MSNFKISIVESDEEGIPSEEFFIHIEVNHYPVVFKLNELKEWIDIIIASNGNISKKAEAMRNLNQLFYSIFLTFIED